MTKRMKTKVKKTVLYGLLFMASKWTITALLYYSGFWSYWFLLLFPIADTIAATFAIIYLRNNFRKYFKKALETSYPEGFREIIKKIETKQTLLLKEITFAAKSKNPLDKKMAFSAYFLSTIKVLEKEGESFETIKKLCVDIAKDYVKPKNKLHKWINTLQPKLINLPFAESYLKRYGRKTSLASHENGFTADVFTDKNTTLGFGYGMDIKACGICTLFKNNQAANYTAIMCEVDKLTFSLAGYELVRMDTIANGASKCDFRFQKL